MGGAAVGTVGGTVGGGVGRIGGCRKPSAVVGVDWLWVGRRLVRRLPPLSIAVVVVGRRLSSVCVDFCRLVFAVEVEAAAPVEAAVAVEVTAVVEIAAVAVGCRGCRRRPSVAIAAFVSIKMQKMAGHMV